MVEWYKYGGIMTKPTAFGFNGMNAMVGGEAGPKVLGHYREIYRKNKLVNSVKAKLYNNKRRNRFIT